jgi:transportin-3
LPQLPAQPKLRYAATLVVGRYAAWTEKHPEFIPSQLAFISEGFKIEEVMPAAALAMKFLCQSCGPVSWLV